MKLLYFSADWCKPCKAFYPLVVRVCEDEQLDMSVVNVEHNMQMSSLHDISSLPTLIILDEERNQLFRHTGAIPEMTLRKILNSLKEGA